MITLVDTTATERLGKIIGTVAEPSDNLVLTGDLGAGKTTLTKGIALGLGIDQMIRARLNDHSRIPTGTHTATIWMSIALRLGRMISRLR